MQLMFFFKLIIEVPLFLDGFRIDPEESNYRWISGARFIVPLENVHIKVPGE